MTFNEQEYREWIKDVESQRTAIDYGQREFRQVVRDLAFLLDVNETWLMERFSGAATVDRCKQCEWRTQMGARCSREGFQADGYSLVLCQQHQGSFERAALSWLAHNATLAALCDAIDEISYRIKDMEGRGDDRGAGIIRAHARQTFDIAADVRQALQEAWK